jgi:hypothetical protein
MGTPQQDANAIGAALHDLESDIATAGSASMTAKVQTLHQLLSQGLVDHFPDVDWYEAAGVTARAASKGAQTNAGGKHEPAPSEV